MIPSTSRVRTNKLKEKISILSSTQENHSLLYNKKIPWQKKNTHLFDVAMGAYDGTEFCEIVGLLLLNN